jgi:hypothetical protein
MVCGASKKYTTSQVVLYWYDFHILNILSIFCYKLVINFCISFHFLSCIQINYAFCRFQNGDDHGHFMVCKLCSTSIPTCYDNILKHVGGSRHLEKLQITQIQSAIHFACKYYVFIICDIQNY